MTNAAPGDHDHADLLSIRAAALLAGVPRAYLHECIAAGRLAVHIHPTSKGVKYRVTKAALVAAGILPVAPPMDPPHASLLELLREQSARLVIVEDQRFQLAGQLGGALERNRLLEERLQLSDGLHPQESLLTVPSETPPQSEDGLQSNGAKPAPLRAAGALARLRGIVRRAGRLPPG